MSQLFIIKAHVFCCIPRGIDNYNYSKLARELLLRLCTAVIVVGYKENWFCILGDCLIKKKKGGEKY